MRRDSAFVFGFSILISAVIVSGLYYMSVQRPIQHASSEIGKQKGTIAEPAVGMSSGVSDPQSNRTDQIIKCIDPDIGEFWTNARDCQSADLDNRMSNAQSYRGAIYPGSKTSESQKDNHKTSKRIMNQKPDIRQVAKEVPDGLSVSCRFAVGRALEIERPLSAADDPAESIWRESYCKWVTEVREEDCNVSSDLGKPKISGPLTLLGFRVVDSNSLRPITASRHRASPRKTQAARCMCFV